MEARLWGNIIWAGGFDMKKFGNTGYSPLFSHKYYNQIICLNKVWATYVSPALIFFLTFIYSGGGGGNSTKNPLPLPHSYPFTPGSCTVQLWSYLQPLSSFSGATGVRGLSGGMRLGQAVPFSATTQITLAGQGFEPATFRSQACFSNH